MAKQKHDIGHQKRGRRRTVRVPENTDYLAHSLVTRGLASVSILNSPTGKYRK
ncbi:hypothetical protein [Paenarthrobacter ureafaciens]|uniref:hypothetical protein n=1 Tax=Paenarthrobacter ureafaciens TaxID=37931 RepID=UPI00140B1666|nr:hypothetical protein [Paenarthrobacter ureafaciens]MCX8453362.1 hypothetical protein [Paenarthrobacter ureafaciens]MCY0972943.1 hypothetical protein [Paenarthrobacter ureafaciens]